MNGAQMIFFDFVKIQITQYSNKQMIKRRSQDQTIQKLCINRKSQNFQYLKEWDMIRAKKLMIHRKLVDEFDESIQQKLVESNAYIDVVRQFLTDLLTQKIKYELHNVDNPQKKIKNNLAGKTIHKNSGKELGRLYQLTNNYKGYKKLKSILEVSLQKVQNLLVESQKTIMEIRTKIELKVIQVQDNNNLALDLCNSLIAVYNKDKNSKPFQSQADLYQEQQRFICQAYRQTQIERQLGAQIVDYLEFVEQLEKKKLVLIKEVIGSYLQGIREQNENVNQLDSLKDILKKQTQTKYIYECYSVQELLSTTIMVELCKSQSKHQKQLTMKYIKSFLKKFQFSSFQHVNYLILKQYHIFIKIDGELQKINLLITVDAFINIYLCDSQIEINNNTQENLRSTVAFTLKIDSSLITYKQGDIVLSLTTKKITYSQNFTPCNTIQLIFSNEDQREQFDQFIEKIMK